MKPLSLLAAGLLALPGGALAISPDNKPSSDTSAETERASFVIHPDFSVSLFADESLGIANPIAIQWDPRGRLWVLCTLAYAQLKPGEVPDDKLYILEDTDADGRADKSTLFAQGLDMPTGFALGHGGAWVAEGADLIHLRDTDGDDRADEKKIILTGFGTGDTHQNISNLVFDAGGFLYFTQGLHTFSQVETPWGVSRGDTAGFWRFDPRITRLDPFGFPSMVSQNPCGVALDRWGALFIKSNGPHLCFATPGLIPTTHSRELMQSAQVGQTPGKSMGGDIVESAHLPDWIQSHAIIAGYFAREVSAIPLVEKGAGFAVSQPVQLIYGGHESFRPVDIRQGPDGAIYIADWFNPIINHYQVSLRHPDRDYSHGRIWKLAAKDRPPVPRPALESMPPDALVQQLRAAERWPREQARRMLTDHPEPGRVADLLQTFLPTLDPADPADTLALIEAAGVLESLGAVPPAVLDQLQISPEPRARAVAARILSRTPEPPADAAGRLIALLTDPHPRPRLEAVVACASRPAPDSLRLALRALDAGPDPFIDHALSQAIFALEPHWLPGLLAGTSGFEKPAHLAFVLETHGGEAAAGLARQALEGDLSPGDRARLLAVLARLGGPADLRAVFAHAAAQPDATLLAALATRRTAPEPPYEPALRSLVDSPDPAIRAAALRLAGLWKTTALADTVEQLALDPATPAEPRSAALTALSQIRGPAAAASLRTLTADAATPIALRRTALEALAAADPGLAARTLADLLAAKNPAADTPSLLPALLSHSGGPAALAAVYSDPGAAPDTATAQEILTAMNRLGRNDARLTPLLNRAIGRQTGAPAYDAGRVQTLVAAIRAGQADVKNGAAVYRLAQLACVACHRVGDEGGVIGPSLNGVGAGLPLDQIVESILWPDRQIKEGYQAIAITTTAGAAITGYIEREGDDIVWYRNAATPWIVPLAKKEIATRETIPTLMPAGLTQSLTDEQLRDLVAYLASLKG
jgi:putative heme-binding domain-containing protein